MVGSKWPRVLPLIVAILVLVTWAMILYLVERMLDQRLPDYRPPRQSVTALSVA